MALDVGRRGPLKLLSIPEHEPNTISSVDANELARHAPEMRRIVILFVVVVTIAVYHAMYYCCVLL